MCGTDWIPWAVAAVARQGASSTARSVHLEPLAWGDTDEAAVEVVAAERAAGEEEAVARRVGLGQQRRRQPGGDGEDLDDGSDGRRIHGHE
jgi:hypothetical protein